MKDHQTASLMIDKGINILLTNDRDNHPSPLDLVEVLHILQQKIKQSSQYIGIPFYIPVSKGAQPRTSHNFKRDIMGEMKELLLDSKHPYDSELDYSSTIRYLVSPIMNRLGLFDHSAAIAASDIVIEKAKQNILMNC